MTGEHYLFIECLGEFLYPWIFVAVVLLMYPIFLALGLEIDVQVYILWSVFGFIAAILTNIFTYLFVFKRKLIARKMNKKINVIKKIKSKKKL